MLLIKVYGESPPLMAPEGKFRLVSIGNCHYPSLHLGDFASFKEAKDRARYASRALLPGMEELEIYDHNGAIVS